MEIYPGGRIFREGRIYYTTSISGLAGCGIGVRGHLPGCGEERRGIMHMEMRSRLDEGIYYTSTRRSTVLVYEETTWKGIYHTTILVRGDYPSTRRLSGRGIGVHAEVDRRTTQLTICGHLSRKGVYYASTRGYTRGPEQDER